MVAQKSFQTASTTSVNTQQDESALPVSETDTIKFSEPDTCVSQKDDKHSLAEKAGVEAFDAYKYQDQIDTIIVAAYQNDAKSVTSNLESLISQLYEEPELTRNPRKIIPPMMCSQKGIGFYLEWTLSVFALFTATVSSKKYRLL